MAWRPGLLCLRLLPWGCWGLRLWRRSPVLKQHGRFWNGLAMRGRAVAATLRASLGPGKVFKTLGSIPPLPHPCWLVPLPLGWGRGVHGFGLPFCPPPPSAPSVSGNRWELRRRGVHMPPDLPCREMAGDLSVTPLALHHGAQRPGPGGPVSPPPSYPTVFLTSLPSSSLSCQEPASEAPHSAHPSAPPESLSACVACPSLLSLGK